MQQLSKEQSLTVYATIVKRTIINNVCTTHISCTKHHKRKHYLNLLKEQYNTVIDTFYLFVQSAVEQKYAEPLK